MNVDLFYCLLHFKSTVKDHHHDADHEATEIDNDEHIHDNNEEHAMIVEDTEGSVSV